MNYVVAGLIVVWFGGMTVIAGLLLNDIRLIYNNIAPGAQSKKDPPLQDSSLRRVADALFFGADMLIFWPVLTVMAMINRSGTDFDRFSGTWITRIDPALLTDTGLVHLKKAKRHEWIALAWMVAGTVVIVWASTYFQAS